MLRDETGVGMALERGWGGGEAGGGPSATILGAPTGDAHGMRGERCAWMLTAIWGGRVSGLARSTYPNCQ
jgi:hypothetical protein